MDRRTESGQVSRREFLRGSAALAACAAGQSVLLPLPAAAAAKLDLAGIERRRVLAAADRYLRAKPVTLTSFSSPRSAGGKHDYFSEGDYWWPDPRNPDGPYIQRDGMSNPDNFVAHRHALIRASVEMPALTAAWMLTKQQRYAAHAAAHARAWFVDPETRMNPNLQYAQAIHGRTTGRGTGVIDTIHLVEVARALELLEQSAALSDGDRDGIRKWFAQYAEWMTTSKNGTEERDAKNNHGTCWVMQVAEFAHYTRNEVLMSDCRTRLKTAIMPHQIAADGSFPEELRRTKPYNYSLFNLDAMATCCQILSTPADDLWRFELPDGRGIAKAVEYMAPFIADKTKWPKPPDVEYFEYFPVRQPSLLFAGLALDRAEYVDIWKKLNPDPTVEEVVRNYPIRQPLLWVNA